MDIGKIHNLINEMEAARKDGRHIDIQTRKLVEKIRRTPTLDRVDASVYVMYPNRSDPVWEHFEGVSDYRLDENGNLSVLVGGNDCDGDWGTVQVIGWPKGSWLKFETDLTPVPNPYFEADDEVSEATDGQG